MASSERTDTTAATPAASTAAGHASAGTEERRGTLADAPASAPTEAVERHSIRFNATSEIAYHALMEGALDRWHRIIMAMVIVSGTASMGAIASIIPGSWAGVITALAPLVVVVLSTLDFVFDLPGQARLHRDIKGKLHEVLADLETCAEQSLPSLKSRLQLIYAMQPPSLRFAQALAYNTAVDALYPRARAAEHYERLPHVALNPLAWVMRVDRAWTKSQMAAVGR